MKKVVTVILISVLGVLAVRSAAEAQRQPPQVDNGPRAPRRENPTPEPSCHQVCNTVCNDADPPVCQQVCERVCE